MPLGYHHLESASEQTVRYGSAERLPVEEEQVIADLNTGRLTIEEAVK